MTTMNNGITVKIFSQLSWSTLLLSTLLILGYSAGSLAEPRQIKSLDFTKSAGGALQLQLEMDGPVIEPRVFHTENPARIALDFSGVKSALTQKKFPINQGAADSVYVAESGGRVRVIVNLLSSVPYETRVEGNLFFLTLNQAADVSAPVMPQTSFLPAVTGTDRKSIVAELMPEQDIKGVDFRRGDRGEGRILVSLNKPNTMVNTKEIGGKVVLSFVNTTLPSNLSRRLDVSEFATPVKYIDTVYSPQETTMTVELQNPLYEYSLFQSEGLLTVEFRPLTQAEKDVKDSQKDRFVGDRLSLNFQDIDIRSVITLLAEFTGQNVVAGDDVVGMVTLKLDDVPWDEALAFIMMTKGLEKYQSGNVTLIAPVGKIKDYKEKQRETERVVEQLEPLQTEYIKINYARAENLSNLLYGRNAGSLGVCGVTSASTTMGQQGGGQGQAGNQMQGGLSAQGGQGGQGNQGRAGAQDDKFSLMSPRGTVVVDGRTNTLIVRETAARIIEIKKLIRELDVPVKQVMIESRIVIADNTFARDLGVRFGVAKQGSIGGSDYGVGGRNTQSDISGAQQISEMLVDLSATNPYGALGMTLARGADYVLNLELSALQDEGRGEILSNPRVMTSDRCEAKISLGQEVPFQANSANQGANINFKEALLELAVMPQITPNGSILMALTITKDEPNFARAIGTEGQPPIIKRGIETNVNVMDGETVVLGGVFEGTQRNNVNKIPFFADLPGIGFLFKKTVTQDDKSELLIFVTPKIVQTNTANN
ncbi:MAG: type IV pilus secretin PilQ [Methylicorpusculum sp.]|uniref:type IV pilus secretin PilQ n=1 Tax=Methylicorpusculum sp. TaxID=2713644 RepID=UPI0027214EBF|nr:type IV pilus secretin PilQ [Methylicorpusculum sp.]MDO8939641.1 type IV pilus secretin PilQ [Methylicorpusculum sp.]MDP2201255.1 type IV pilus secretin PilQ [Methylicorpusculum sp.]